MTDQEFQSALEKFKHYLKPQMFAALVDTASAFSDETKQEIVSKFQEAESQMKELNDYQEERNGIMKRGLAKMDEVYNNVKAKFQLAGEADKASDTAEAEKLLTDM